MENDWNNQASDCLLLLLMAVIIGKNLGAWLMIYEFWDFNMFLILPRKIELLQKYLVTICYPCVRYTQFWQKNVPTWYDQGSVILSLTLDRCTLSQRTGWAGADAYWDYFDSF